MKKHLEWLTIAKWCFQKQRKYINSWLARTSWYLSSTKQGCWRLSPWPGPKHIVILSLRVCLPSFLTSDFCQAGIPLRSVSLIYAFDMCKLSSFYSILFYEQCVCVSVCSRRQMICVIAKFWLPFWLHVCPGKTCVWQNQCVIILEGMLVAGEVPAHRQSTAEVPLHKVPNPQTLKQHWCLIQGCNLLLLHRIPQGKSSPEEVCFLKKQSIVCSVPESHRLFLVLTPNHNWQTLRIPVHVPQQPSFPTICPW